MDGAFAGFMITMAYFNQQTILPSGNCHFHVEKIQLSLYKSVNFSKHNLNLEVIDWKIA